MTHKEKDLLVGRLVDKNVALKNRVDYLESQDYEGRLTEIEEAFESYKGMADDMTNEISSQLFESEQMTSILLNDIRLLYKRLDDKDEDIQILNTLIGNK